MTIEVPEDKVQKVIDDAIEEVRAPRPVHVMPQAVVEAARSEMIADFSSRPQGFEDVRQLAQIALIRSAQEDTYRKALENPGQEPPAEQGHGHPSTVPCIATCPQYPVVQAEKAASQDQDAPAEQGGSTSSLPDLTRLVYPDSTSWGAPIGEVQTVTAADIQAIRDGSLKPGDPGYVAAYRAAQVRARHG